MAVSFLLFFGFEDGLYPFYSSYALPILIELMSEAISSTVYKDASCLALLVICILRMIFLFDIISLAASGKPVSKEFTLYLFFITGMSSTSLLVVLNELSRIAGFSLYRCISTA